jgi:enterochelin esterase-like enzyme
MLEPQSTFLFIVLVIAFGALMWWMIRTRRAAVRIVAALIAFVVGVQFGILAVNRYFDYYQTWGSAIADFTNAGPAKGPAAVSVGTVVAKSWRNALASHTIYAGLAMHQGYTFQVSLAGPKSHITRDVYVYLPPQYFQARYRHYRFPVIELIHGQPGEPQDWINVVGITGVLESLVNLGRAKPAVLVMPDANGGQRVSLQCLNQAGGPQDMTYLGLDVPNAIATMGVRVQPPGPGWGIAGYSEGGYCAANMALQPQLRRKYGAAASLSGYFVPFNNQMPDGRVVNPFGGNVALKRENTPIDEIETLKPGTTIPLFWLGAGKSDREDVAAAEYFWQELQIYQASVPLRLTAGGHTMAVWRAQVPPMLEWMTDVLSRNVANIATKIRLAARRARECHLTSGTRPAADPGRSPAAKGAKPHPAATPSASLPAFCYTKPLNPAKHQVRKVKKPARGQSPTRA